MALPTLLLFLHISLIFTAMTVAYGPLIVVWSGYSMGQVAVIRTGVSVVNRIGPLLPVLFVLGGLFGLFTAIAFGYNLTAPWLVIAYVLFALMMLIGVTEQRTWPIRVASVLDAAPDGPVSPEVVALFRDPRMLIPEAVSLVVVFVLIFDMVIKPFS